MTASLHHFGGEKLPSIVVKEGDEIVHAETTTSSKIDIGLVTLCAYNTCSKRMPTL